MPRTWYEVVPIGREWAVCCKSRLLSLHLDKCNAISIAAAVAEGEQECTGQPTGVRVRQDDGSWDEQGVFGTARGATLADLPRSAPVRFGPAGVGAR